MEYGEKIAALRKLKGMTQAELGNELNVTFQAVSKWERGESLPDFATMSKIAKLFGVPLEYFGDGDYQPAEEAAATATAAVAPQPKMLGVCTVCGKVVNEGEEAQTSPALICKACTERKAEESRRAVKEEKNRQERAKQYDIAHNKKWRNVGLIVAACVCLGLLITISVVWGTGMQEFSWVGLGAFAVFLLFTFTFMSQMFWNGTVLEVALFGVHVIGTPGVIFSLDLEGIIFLIAVKILFMILKIVCLFLFTLLTFVAAFLISPFSFLPQLIKLNKGGVL
ncbi:MAG: helix-turn-helix domain-containing protein [Clostridia bacterium]|nr:helix-turn-helix domain-containing protein [Clostridia bacterium]